MPIQVACSCGQKFSAKDELAGKRAKCPKCGQPLVIGAPAKAEAASSDPLGGSGGVSGLMDQAGFEKAGGTACPKCNAGMQRGAVLCVECGYHLETGEVLKTKFLKDDVEVDDGSTVALQGIKLKSKGNAILDQAQRDFVREKLLQESVMKTAPLWLIVLALGVFVGFVATVIATPEKQRSEAGLMWQYGGFGMIGLAYLGLVFQAFRVRQAVGWFTVISGGLYFLFGRRTKDRATYAYYLVLLALFSMGAGKLFEWVNADVGGEFGI